MFFDNYAGHHRNFPEVRSKTKRDDEAGKETSSQAYRENAQGRDKSTLPWLFPSNVEFDIPSLDVDATHEHPLGAMVQEVKIKITWSNENGRLFSSSKKLSVFDEEPDLLRPLIPMFKWKK